MKKERLGRYVLLERLAKGGMAEVWRARTDGGASVVIKRMHAFLAEDTQFRRMFAVEARVTARLEHPNIARFVELGDAGGELFLVMEEVAGIDLGTLLRAHGRALPLGAALHVARDVARALAHAHEHDVIHRDVTPSNVMVGFDGVVRLIDFGIAKAVAEIADAKTKTGVLKGKIGYMAPEQLRAGETVDARADVYAAGVLLHEMLCGRRLFKAESDTLVVDLVLAGNVRAPSATNGAVPASVEAICMQALARDRQVRTASAAELAARLDEELARSGWSATETGVLAAKLAPPEEETTREDPVPLTAPATLTDAQPPRPAPRWRRVALIASIAGVAALVAVALWRRSHHAPLVASPPVAASPPIAAPPAIIATPIAATPPVAAPPVAAPPVAAPTPSPPAPHKKRKRGAHHADIERGDVVDPFHRK